MFGFFKSLVGMTCCFESHKGDVMYHCGMSVRMVRVTLQSLLELVANEVSNDSCKQDERLQKVYSNTLEHIKAQKHGEGEVGQRYEAINI